MAMNRSPSKFLLSLTGVCLLLASCGGPRDYHVAGTIQYQGATLPAGQIFFDPDYTRGNDGPSGFAMVKAGKFDTRQQGRGVIGGLYKIRIEGFDGQPGNELPLGKPIFKLEVSRDLPKADSTLELELPEK